MKQITFITILLIMFNIVNTQAQKFKYGYLNSEKLLSEMTEVKNANKQLETFITQINDHIKEKNKEYKQKITDYKKNEKSFSELIKKDKQKELNKLQEDIKQFQINAQNEINKKKQELYKPAIDKLRKAINKVSKENSFKFVIDNSKGQLLYFEEEDNIEPLIKRELRIK